MINQYIIPKLVHKTLNVKCFLKLKYSLTKAGSECLCVLFPATEITGKASADILAIGRCYVSNLAYNQIFTDFQFCRLAGFATRQVISVQFAIGYSNN